MDTIISTPEDVVDDLVYSSYKFQRDLNPNIAPERWAKIFTNGPAMERRYQRELATRGKA